MDIIPLNKWIKNLKGPLIIAGPCSAESEEQVMATAKKLEYLEEVTIFRAGIWKPRTRPNTFEGVGEKGLPWLKRVKNETRLMTACEVANAHHVELALKNDVDIIWIGARTTVNPFAVQEIADSIKGTNIPVMIKNPINADLALWIGALERISQAGITKLAAIHRGFSVGEKLQYRNRPLWKIPMELKRTFPNLPVICDPSHICGNRELLAKVSQKSFDLDMDGIMLETHINPEVALSDAAQQVTPDRLKEIIDSLSYKTEYSTDRVFENELDDLREKIDRVDAELLDILKMRMDIVLSIGKAKKAKNITALQVSRMDQLMNERMDKGESLGLHRSYIKELYQIIHDYSVKKQIDISEN